MAKEFIKKGDEMVVKQDLMISKQVVDKYTRGRIDTRMEYLNEKKDLLVEQLSRINKELADLEEVDTEMKKAGL